MKIRARDVLWLWALVYLAVAAFCWTIASGCAHGGPSGLPCDQGPGYQLDSGDSLITAEGQDMNATASPERKERKRPEEPAHEFGLFGGKARLVGFGTFPGSFDSTREANGYAARFLTWHDGENRKVPKTTAAVLFEGAKVNGVTYGGRFDFLWYPKGYGGEPETWHVQYPSWIRREGGGEPTDKARKALKDTVEAYVRDFAKTGPGMVFFGYKAERFALADEWYRCCVQDDELTRDLIACRRQKQAYADRIVRLDATHGGRPERVVLGSNFRDREDMREQAKSEGGI